MGGYFLRRMSILHIGDNDGTLGALKGYELFGTPRWARILQPPRTAASASWQHESSTCQPEAGRAYPVSDIKIWHNECGTFFCFPYWVCY